MPEMKTLNGYEIVDAKARQAVANIKHPTKQIITRKITCSVDNHSNTY